MGMVTNREMILHLKLPRQVKIREEEARVLHRKLNKLSVVVLELELLARMVLTYQL